METYNFQKAVENDVRDYIDGNIGSLSAKYATKWEAIDDLQEDLFTNDSVTGNASGSYTFDKEEAQKNLFGNYFLLCDAYEEFGYDGIPFKAMQNPEIMDVAIRCYLLGSAVAEVVEDMWDGE